MFGAWHDFEDKHNASDTVSDATRARSQPNSRLQDSTNSHSSSDQISIFRLDPP